MSKPPIDPSPDLKKLRDEGYDVEIRSGYLLMKDVPYVNAGKEIRRGILVSKLTMAGDVTAAPGTHVAMFAGEYPCDENGRELDQIRHGNGRQLADNLVVQYSFSSKPVGGVRYKDYHEKMTAYAAILLSRAQAIDPTVTAQTFPVFAVEEEESVFRYLDTATSRAGINLATQKLELAKVAIVGLGGTGSYVLDLVAKTPVKEVHLFDKDTFLSHNAFRSPGAVSVEELRTGPKKVTRLKELYSKLRRGIVDHDYNIGASNVAELRDMAFVFLCIDPSDEKKAIVEGLEAFGTPFLDVGMGLDLVGDSLGGILRTTMSTKERREHFRARVSLSAGDRNPEYDSNIQIADLNALNAALAVIRWKKLFGFYLDLGNEYHTTYTIDTNAIINDDAIEAAHDSLA